MTWRKMQINKIGNDEIDEKLIILRIFIFTKTRCYHFFLMKCVKSIKLPDCPNKDNFPSSQFLDVPTAAFLTGNVRVNFGIG